MVRCLPLLATLSFSVLSDRVVRCCRPNGPGFPGRLHPRFRAIRHGRRGYAGSSRPCAGPPDVWHWVAARSLRVREIRYDCHALVVLLGGHFRTPVVKGRRELGTLVVTHGGAVGTTAFDAARSLLRRYAFSARNARESAGRSPSRRKRRVLRPECGRAQWSDDSGLLY